MSGTGHLSRVAKYNVYCWVVGEKMQAHYLLVVEKAKFNVLRDSETLSE